MENNQSAAIPDEGFIHRLRCALDGITDEDSTGQIFGFVRAAGQLVPKALSVQDIKLDKLCQYEMILVDGGNKHGDRWKHTFLPQINQHFFVDEAPRHAAAPARIEVSLDGGETYRRAPEGVRIQYNRVQVPGEDELGVLQVNATHEGLIMDVWVTRDETLDHNIGTSSQLVEDLIEKMVEDNA